ncbi:MAG: zf-HC2 domain-containing protein [Polyangiaceae bacterium]
MSCEWIRRGDLDAYSSSELGSDEARSLEAHLFGCAECARELRRLRAEQRLFRARAEAEREAVPSFEPVLARIDGDSAGSRRASRAGRREDSVGWTARLAPAGVAFAALAAAAASLVGIARSPSDLAPPARDEADIEAVPSERICLGEPAPAEDPRVSMPVPASVATAPMTRIGPDARDREPSGDDNEVCAPGGRTGELCAATDTTAPATYACEDTVAWCGAPL